MSINIEQRNNVSVVKLQGKFDIDQSTQARQVFSELVESAPENIFVDFSDVSYVDSSGIGAIVFLYKRLRCDGKDLVIGGLKNQPAELIKLLRIDKIIQIRDEF